MNSSPPLTPPNAAVLPSSNTSYASVKHHTLTPTHTRRARQSSCIEKQNKSVVTKPSKLCKSAANLHGVRTPALWKCFGNFSAGELGSALGDCRLTLCRLERSLGLCVTVSEKSPSRLVGGTSAADPVTWCPADICHTSSRGFHLSFAATAAKNRGFLF